MGLVVELFAEDIIFGSRKTDRKEWDGLEVVDQLEAMSSVWTEVLIV